MDIQRVLRDMPYQIKSALTLHNKMKRQLLTAIKEYLRFKYKQTTSFYPDDEDVSGLLEENSFSLVMLQFSISMTVPVVVPLTRLGLKRISL